MIAAQELKYVLFEDITVKWVWKECELIRFREMWEVGEPVNKIAKVLKTNQLSVALLVVDQAENGFVKRRARGLYGN